MAENKPAAPVQQKKEEPPKKEDKVETPPETTEEDEVVVDEGITQGLDVNAVYGVIVKRKIVNRVRVDDDRYFAFVKNDRAHSYFSGDLDALKRYLKTKHGPEAELVHPDEFSKRVDPDPEPSKETEGKEDTQ